MTSRVRHAPVTSQRLVMKFDQTLGADILDSDGWGGCPAGDVSPAVARETLLQRQPVGEVRQVDPRRIARRDREADVVNVVEVPPLQYPDIGRA